MRVVPSLKRAFTLHYIIAASVPIIVFAWFFFHYANDYLLGEVFHTNEFLAHEIRAQVEDFLHQRSASLEHVAKTIFDKRFFRQTEALNHYLSEEVDSSQDFESIYVLDRSGKVVNLGLTESQRSWQEDYYGIDLSGNELYQSFMRGEAPGWSDTYTSLVTGEPSISLGIAAGDHLVVGNLSLRRLGSIVSRFSLYDQPLSAEGGAPVTFAIVDSKGVPIAHTSAEPVLRQKSMRFHPEVVNALAGISGTDVYTHDGKRLVESGLSVPETGWAVWISRNYDLVSQPLVTTRNVFFIILSASILIAVLFGLLTARSVLRPLGVLIDGVRALARGSSSVQQGGRSYAEIEELTHGFHRMSQSVRERELSLRLSENRFRSLVNSIEGIVFEADYPELTFTFVNERSEQILGYPAGRWLETPDFWQECIHPDDRQWAYNYSLNQAGSGRSHQLEYRMLHHDGQIVWVRQMVNVVMEEGRPTRLLGVIIDVTGSKEAAISLQESEQRFRSLVEQAADAIFIHDANGQLVDVNEQACRSLGYSREELKRKRIPDFQVLQSPLDFTALQNSVIRGGSLTFEAEHRRKNNTLFPVEIRLGTFQYQDSPLFLALVRDITDRKRAVAALRESEERYRTVVAAMNEGVILTDNEGRIVALNPAAERILRATSNEVLGRCLDDEDWPRFRENGGRYPVEELPAILARKTGQPVKNALVGFPGKDATLDWIEINALPVTAFGEGRSGGVLVTMNDVTEKRAADAALRESEERVRLLLDSTAEGIYGMDLARQITFCNPAAVKLLGFAAESELLGSNAHATVHHSYVDGTPYPIEDCPICRVFDTGRETHSDGELFWRRDGSSFSVEYFAHPVIKDGELVGVVVAFHDVTERKLLQQQHIRTAQLASLGELAAGVAHEINNPISGVINYAQILLNRSQKNGDESELAQRIIKEGERVATIVRDLLFFARESGPEMALSDIRAILEDSLSLSAAQIRKEGIMLQIDYADDLPMVNTRAQQIQQLFLNVLSNARHALNQKYPVHDENKRIEVTIETLQREGGGWVRIRFRDFGIGIPAAMLERVMHPFVTTKPSGVGTGLGLSISFEIVKKHGGELWIESVEGEHTDVFIELPLPRKD